ncbi:MAG: hypothetical protein AAGD06_12510 [Acidobacteriota bacterium]
MKRRHLIELHEQPWFPSVWRRMFQDGLGKAQTHLGAFDNLGEKVSRFLHRVGATDVLDLCSGSAEIIVDLRRKLGAPLEDPESVRFVVSDLYPNLQEFERLRALHPDALSYYPQPVNAFRPPADAPRIRSIVSALHHFKPADARRILEDAARNSDGIMVLESTGRSWAHLLGSIPVPFVAALICGFGLRPFKLQHILWSLLVPVVPLTALWDTVVSHLRTYTVDELRRMTESIDAPDFEWEIGTLPVGSNNLLRATYLFGWRTSASS